MTNRCNLCFTEGLSDNDALKHTLSCGVPTEIHAQLNYWRNIAQLAQELHSSNGIEELTTRKPTSNEGRAIFLLLSVGMTKLPLSTPPPEACQIQILKYAPTAALAMMELAGLIKLRIENGEILVDKV